MSARRKQQRTILLVEDDPGDQELIRRAFENAGGAVTLHIAADGEDALDFLLARGQYTARPAQPLPQLVLLDMNMPRLDGRGVLKAMRTDPQLRSIPVVILTTSENADDVRTCHELGCNSFIAKPTDPDELVRVCRGLIAYWFELVTLPQR